MRLNWTGAVLLLAAALCAAEDTKKAEPEPKKEEQGKELIMLELERVDNRDKRQTEGEADFSNKEVPPEYLSLLQQLQLQGGEPAPGQLENQQAVQQYYIAKTPSGVISGGPLDRSPQRFLPAPGEPRPFRPRDPVLNAISRQNSALQAEYARKAIRDQETVFLMPRGPVGADPPRAGPLALAGLYRPGAQPPQPPQGIPVAPGRAVGLAQSLPAFSAHDARLRSALQGQEVIQAPSQQYASPQYIQLSQARGLAALSGGPASELSLVREAAQQLQGRQPQLQQQLQPQLLRQAPRPQPQQTINYQELSPAELRFVQRQQEQESAGPPGPRYVLQPNPQQLQAQIEANQQIEAQQAAAQQAAAQQAAAQQEAAQQAAAQQAAAQQAAAQRAANQRAEAQQAAAQRAAAQQAAAQHAAAQQAAAQQAAAQEAAAAQSEEQYLRETTPGGPPPLPIQPARSQLQLQPQPQLLRSSVLQPSPLYLQQVQQLAEQQALARQQVAQLQQPSEDVQYVRQPQRYAPPRASPSPQEVPVTTPRSSIFVSTATNPKPQARRPSVTIEQLLQPEQEKGSLPQVRLPANQKPLSQADLQQLIDAGFDVSPVPDPNPTGSAYYRSSAAGDYSGAPQRFAPIVVPDEPAPRLSPRQRQALLQAQEDAYLRAQAGAGVRLGSSGN